MAGFADMADEVRSHVHAVENLLGQQNDLLKQIANKPPDAVKLTHLNVLSEAQLRTVPFPANEALGLIYRGVQGTYVKLNHWAIHLDAEELENRIAMFYGNDQEQNVLDTLVPLTNALGVGSRFASSNPNELIIPPGFNIYIRSPESGKITLSLTSYNLTT
jgi:hypothetical protein